MHIPILAGVQKGHISGQKIVVFCLKLYLNCKVKFTWMKIVLELQAEVQLDENFLISILDLCSYIVAYLCTFPS